MNILSLALLVIGGLIAMASAVLVMGAFLPRLPYVGVYGSLIWPTLIGPATLFATLGTLLSLVAYVLDPRPWAAALVALGFVAMVGSLVILAAQVIDARRAGVPVRLRSFTAIGLGPKSAPDLETTYGTGPDGEPLRMLVYRPRATATAVGPAGAAVVVYIHGGGWYQGAPDDIPAVHRWFADQGYLVLAPAYTLATDERPTWDTAMPQVASALGWVGQHARDYGGDPERIAVWGGSAGANLALAATYAAAGGSLHPSSFVAPFPRVAAVAGEVPAVDPGWIEHNSDRIWGPRTREMVVRYIGGSSDEHPERLVAIQVESYLSPLAPPTLLMASRGDHLVPIEGIRRFVDKARAAGVDVRMVERPWGDHLISVIHDGLTSQTMIRLLADHFRRHGV